MPHEKAVGAFVVPKIVNIWTESMTWISMNPDIEESKSLWQLQVLARLETAFKSILHKHLTHPLVRFPVFNYPQ